MGVYCFLLMVHWSNMIHDYRSPFLAVVFSCHVHLSVSFGLEHGVFEFILSTTFHVALSLVLDHQ